MPTGKLYHQDSYLRIFDATILKVLELPKNHYGLVLDQTAFYPESGGQPYDTGTINGFPVLAVHEDAGEIIHILEERPDLGPVHGEINWSRRFDHMQQHSGEHILSAAFADIFGTKNVGFHIGASFSTIDLDMDHFSQDKVTQVENYANDMVFANRQISSRFVDKAGLEQAKLRKAVPKEYAQIRLVDIAGCDCCPCGGTHVAFTGEIGLIKIRSWERHKGGIRLEFVCGGRALGDYQLKTTISTELAALLSSPVEALAAACEQQTDRIHSLSREITLLKRERNKLLAENLISTAEEVQAVKLVTLIQNDLTPIDLNALAACLTSERRVVALMAGVEPENGRAHLVFSRTQGIEVNMHELLKEVLATLDGRGGGKPEAAQGGCKQIRNLPAALETAKLKIKHLLSGI